MRRLAWTPMDAFRKEDSFHKRAAALAALALICLPPSGARATPWHTMGPRAMGMGGAQVAVAQGPLASYWNPAGLGQLYNTSGLAVPVGARGEFSGTVLQGAKDINEISEACQAGNAAVCTSANINAALVDLGQPGNGAMADVGAGLELKIRRLVVFVNGLTYVGGTPRVDLGNTGACVAAPGCLDRNRSRLVLRGASFTELGAGYARELGRSGLILGGNLKGIVGKVGYTEINVASEDAGDGNFGDFSRDSRTSFQPGVDLGVLWDLRESLLLPMRPRFGLVGRNLNNPGFSQPDSAKTAGDRSKFSLHGQLRAGAALSPLKFWHLAGDLDLTDNVTNVDGVKSRYLSAGTEINVFNRTWINIPLRAGLQKNLSSAGSGLSYTGGFGLNFLHLIFDVGAMASAKRTTVQSQGGSEKIPNNVALSGQFAFLFGGKDEGGRGDK